MKISVLREASADQLKEIEAFVRNHPDSTYFHSTLFFKSCQCTPLVSPLYVVAYSETNLLKGTLLAFRQDQYSFFPLNFLSSRFIIWGGPLILEDDVLVLQGLYEAYHKVSSSALYTQIRNLSDQSQSRNVMDDLGYQYDDHLDILIDLRSTEEQLWREIHTKRKNEIRRAINEGVCVRIQNDLNTLDECYNVLKEVYQRAKLPLPDINHFRSLLTNSTSQDGLKVFVAKFDGKIIGCMLCLAYSQILFDYYAGSYQSFYPKHPNDLLPWEVFKWGKANGYTKFDFGGAGKPGVPYGVRDYKKKFGGELRNYGRYEKIHHPILYNLMLRAFKVWQFLKK